MHFFLHAQSRFHIVSCSLHFHEHTLGRTFEALIVNVILVDTSLFEG
jgi:hypothetical protein